MGAHRFPWAFGALGSIGSPLNATYHTSLQSLQCLGLPTETPRRATTQVFFARRFDLSMLISQVSVTDGYRGHPQSIPQQLPQGESRFGDSSGPLFSIYSKAAEEEDNKMVERWQKDADGILFFVSLCFGIHIVLCINRSAVDWSIFCRSCRTPFRDYRGSKTKQPGYLCILSWEHLSGSRRPECNTCYYSIPFCQTTPVFSSEICCLG